MKKQKKTKRIHIKVTERQKNRIIKLAEGSNLTISAYILSRILDKNSKEYNDIAIKRLINKYKKKLK